MIIERIEDKNPADRLGWTPLHVGALYGRLDVCKFIIENVSNKLPVDKFGSTPKDLADRKGFVEISQLF